MPGTIDGMVLIIGGMGQGKLDFARRELGVSAWSEGKPGADPRVEGRRRLPAAQHGGNIQHIRRWGANPCQRPPPLGAQRFIRGTNIAALQVSLCLAHGWTLPGRSPRLAGRGKRRCGAGFWTHSFPPWRDIARGIAWLSLSTAVR